MRPGRGAGSLAKIAQPRYIRAMPNVAAIHAYRSEVDQIIRFGGSSKETTVRRAVFNLINAYARPRDLLLVEELDYYNPQRKKRVTPDGTLKNILRLDYGFWESKDTTDFHPVKNMQFFDE